MPRKAGAQPNQSLMDGIATLQALAVSSEPVGCRELARRLGLETTRVNRLLKTLTYLGLAHQTTNKKYTTGSGMNVLAAQSLSASRLLRNAIGPLEQLQRFGRVVALGVLWRDSISFLYHAQPGMSPGEAIGRIGLYPATLSGVGMILLAQLHEEEITELYDNSDIPGFPDGVKSLIDRLGQIREQGYSRVEITPTTPLYPGEPHHTIAVPIGEPVSSALGISGWMPDSAVPDVVEALQKAKHDIETAEVSGEAPQLDIAALTERFKEHARPPATPS